MKKTTNLSGLKDMDIRFKYVPPNSINHQNLVNFLIEIDYDFGDPLSKRVDIFEYAQKLKKNANHYIAYKSGSDNILGFIAFYANDERKIRAFIPIIGVISSLRRQGIGKKLIEMTLSHLKSDGFEKVALETLEKGPARFLYEQMGFKFTNCISEEKRDMCRINMELNFNPSICKFDFSPTKIEEKKRISKELNINLICKRDDLFSFTGGGNKARKLYYILAEAQKKGYNAIVTAGANQSNHVRATAIFATQLGWKTIMIIHDLEPNGTYSGNLKLTKLVGAELRFVNKENVAQSMDKAMNDLRNEGFNPLYIWGGGHCLEGSYAYYEAVKELKSQIGSQTIDFIVLASGTGTTQAGIEIGCRRFFPKCKVMGVSVARDPERGKKAVLESMIELNDFLSNPVDIPEDIFFDDTWKGDGYEGIYPELLETIHWAARTEGLILDSTYTGKAFHALRNYVSKGIIPENSNVVFWHTGGLLNLMASDVI